MKHLYVVRNKDKKVVFSNPSMDACVKYFKAGDGMKYGWTVEQVPLTWKVK